MSDSTLRVADFFGLSPLDEDFLAACTHPTFAHESPGTADNQRLEFLGDAILDFYVSRVLFEEFPEAQEGELTRVRAQIVSTEALAEFCRKQELASALRTGKGSRTQLLESDNVLADLVEALVAAAYRKAGSAHAEAICEQIVRAGLARKSSSYHQDPKSGLQEEVQAVGFPAPTYRVVSQSGPAHQTSFIVHVYLDGRCVGEGEGRSKRLAERAAAQDALRQELYKQESEA